MLPARVAATLTASLDDFSPVLECLRRPDCQDRSAAVFLVQHCTGALAAGVVPNGTLTSPRGAWPSIARELAGAAIQDVGWMLKPLIAQWAEAASVLLAAEASRHQLAARLMLRQASGEPARLQHGRHRNPGCRATSDTALGESIQALNELLLPDHLMRMGMRSFLGWPGRSIPHDRPSSAVLLRHPCDIQGRLLHTSSVTRREDQHLRKPHP